MRPSRTMIFVVMAFRRRLGCYNLSDSDPSCWNWLSLPFYRRGRVLGSCAQAQCFVGAADDPPLLLRSPLCARGVLTILHCCSDLLVALAASWTILHCCSDLLCCARGVLDDPPLLLLRSPLLRSRRPDDPPLLLLRSPRCAHGVLDDPPLPLRRRKRAVQAIGPSHEEIGEEELQQHRATLSQ